MEDSRRVFLKTCGIWALGLAGPPVLKTWAGTGLPPASPNPAALTAGRWGMVVDMKKCREKGKPGCRDCILACHQVHNVPDIGDPREEIKWIWTEAFERVFPERQDEHAPAKFKGMPFLVFCNHCGDAPCVRVCPTGASFKSRDGITMTDFHRCIGCRYCMAACPYGARSFNFRDPRPHIRTELNTAFPTRERGVVEKCGFCSERLAVGLLPACVEACKCGALRFGDLEDPDSGVRKTLGSRFTIRRRPELGTQPGVYYIV